MRYGRKRAGLERKGRVALLCLFFLFLLGGCREKAALYDSEQLPLETGEGPENHEEPEEESSGQETRIWVYVCGQVESPGLYELHEGARMADAVEAAGGMTAEASQEYLNLAEKISDGQKIQVPSQEEASALEEEAEAASQGLINLNTASGQELMTLTGIGESKAREIIKYREQKGGFQKTEELMEIPGIKEGVFQKIKDQITV